MILQRQMNKNYQVTDIKPKDSSLNSLELYIDNEYFADIDYSTIIELNIHIGKVITQQAVEAIRQNVCLTKAKNEAIRFLSYRPRSEWEIRNKLNSKNYQQNIISTVIDWLKEIDLINDREFSFQWIKYLIGKKPAGKIKLKNELYKKGISREIINCVIDLFFSQEEDELELAEQLINKKHNSLLSKNTKLEPSKIIGLLKRQGFSDSVIQKIYYKFTNQEEQYT